MDELYRSNFGGKPESNLNLIPVKLNVGSVRSGGKLSLCHPLSYRPGE